MAKQKNSSGVSVEFKDWTDLMDPQTQAASIRITMIHMYEKLGGEVAEGDMDLLIDGSDEAMKYVTDKSEGTILLKDEKEGGLSYEIPVYITSRSYLGNILSIHFKCIKDINFLTKRVSINYQDGIKNTIMATYPGNSDIRIEPGVNDVLLLQNNETNYEFNRRLAYSYKKNSIFAYGWEGLLIKDLCGEKDSKGNTEPKLQLSEGKAMFQTEPYNLKYDTALNHEPYNPWQPSEESITKNDHTEHESLNIAVTMDLDNYTITGKDFGDYQQNMFSNMKMMDKRGYSAFKTVLIDMPGYKLGDVVIYSRKTQEEQKIKLPFELYLVAANELFYSIDSSNKVNDKHMKFGWTTTFFGLDNGEWTKDKE